MLIHLFVIEPFLCGFSSVPGIWTHIGNDALGDKGTSEFLSVKSCVEVAEEAVDSNISRAKLTDYFIHPVLYLEEVGMTASLRLSHGKRYPLIIREEKCIGRTSLLPSLIFSLFSSTVCRCMGTVNMGDGKIKLTFILIEDSGIDPPPFLLNRPFTVMMEDCVPTRKFPAEKMAYRQQTPLASALELVEDCIYNLNKIEFGSETSFCYRKIRKICDLYK